MKRLTGLLIFLLLIPLVWGALWVLGANQIRNRAQDFFAATANDPVSISCTDIAVTGFPLTLDVTCTDLQIRQDDLVLTLPRIAARMDARQPTRIEIEASGPARLVDSFSGSRRQLDWSGLHASLQTNGWALDRVILTLENAELTDALIGQRLVASARRFELEARDDPAGYDPLTSLAKLTINGSLSGAHLPEFAINQAEMTLKATLGGIPDDIRKWSLQTIAQNWFDHETGIELLGLEGKDTKSEFRLNGYLSATAQLLPNGDFDLTTSNVAERIAPFLDSGSLDVLLGMQNRDRTRYQSYAIRHGVVLAANLPLLTLAPLH